MKFVIFGLSISSSWGNGHATLWRGLCRALGVRGHRVVFFERDVVYYAAHRDYDGIAGVRLVLYEDWSEVEDRARLQVADAEVAIVTSFCPDSVDATDLLTSSSVPVRVFYDMDAPVTLAQVRTGQKPSYVGPRGYRDFDLVLSYAGGEALQGLRQLLGARRVAPLYGSVDPLNYHPAGLNESYRSDLSYLGTYADDRQQALDRLFVAAARRMPQYRFLIGGAQYPSDFPWTENTHFVQHLPPSEHPAFYCSSRLTLNVTRAPMIGTGFCPSGRLFEAAACGAPMITDRWPGLSLFFEPSREIIEAESTEDVLQALNRPQEELDRIGRAARERCLDCHTSRHRAEELECVLESARVENFSQNEVQPPRAASELGVFHVGNYPGCGQR